MFLLIFFSARAQTPFPEGRYNIKNLRNPSYCVHLYGSPALKTDRVRQFLCSKSSLQIFNIVKVGSNYRLARDKYDKYGIAVSTGYQDLRVEEYNPASPNYSLWSIDETTKTSANTLLKPEEREYNLKNIGGNNCFDLYNGWSNIGNKFIRYTCQTNNDAQAYYFSPIV